MPVWTYSFVVKTDVKPVSTKNSQSRVVVEQVGQCRDYREEYNNQRG